jgi:D-alanyl-lipoteichoic acid acyltransferase DltB (MBOAT superfamily)
MSKTVVSEVADRPRDPESRSGLRERIAMLPGQSLILAQLVALALVVRAFALESPAFGRVFLLVVGGYAAQMLLPSRLRLPLFAMLSVIAAVIVFGVTQAAWLVAIGLGLIGLVHLPLPFAVRVASILLAAIGLALLRSEIWTAPWSSGLWPIFAAMFMFRLIVYLYDLRHHAAPVGFWRTVCYFFMLPTVCFPIFPVVDYKTMWRTWVGGKEALRVHQTGADWILRGLVQLLLYRLVYHSLSADPEHVEHASQALLYLVRPCLLYLKISGSLHLVIGIMHLYGFDLPRTSHNYFLASSFTDYWRRINIYWKDFIQKVVFNPAYFRLNRRMGATASLVVATLIAFFATWALHSYQWFWIRRTFPVIWQDIVFWSVMGLAVLANMLFEARAGRRRRLGKAERTLRTELGLALRTIGTFSVICLIWAVWSTPSLAELRHVMSRLLVVGAADLAWIVAGVGGLGLAAIVYERREQRTLRRAGGPPSGTWLGPLWVSWSAVHVGVSCAALLGLVYASLVFYYPPAVADVVDRLKNPLRMNRGDAAKLDRGYYEELTDVARFNPELAQIYAQKPADWDRCWALHRTEGFPTFEMLPSRRVAFMGAMLTTNRWAMRDRDYQQKKPAGTYRVALLGASHGMGGGIEDALTFENQAEDRLNAATDSPHRRYEILNFSVAGYGPAAQLWRLERDVWPFEPDAVVVTGVDDLMWIAREVVGGAAGRYGQPFPAMTEAARAAAIDEKTPHDVAMAKMGPYREQVLRDIYQRVVRACRDHGARPFALFIAQPRIESPEALIPIRRQVEIAREAGLTTIDLLDTYAGAPDLASLWVAPWDRHPNSRGHAMLGDRMYRALRSELRP